MQQIVIDKPYQFIPPHRGHLWPRLLSLYVRRHRAKNFGITHVHVRGTEHLLSSLRAGHGILLTPNHVRDCDPLVLAELIPQTGRFFYIMASWHVFMQSRLQRFLVNRAGGFSVYREGMDREALSTATDILETAERPLIIFPEGVAMRTNDHLHALMDGTALIARSAAKKRAKTDPSKKVVVHPLFIRYQFKGNLDATVKPVLDEIEHRLSWRPQRELPLVQRIQKVGLGLLALKEIEYLGSPQPSLPIEARLTQLIDHLLSPLEDQWVKGQHDGTVVGRVKRLRAAILPDLIKNELSEDERQRRWTQLADCYLAQQLAHYPPDYVRADPTPERLLETVERFEEDLTDEARIHRPMEAVVTIAPAIEVPTERQRGADGDPLMQKIENELVRMMGEKSDGSVGPTRAPATTRA